MEETENVNEEQRGTIQATNKVSDSFISVFNDVFRNWSGEREGAQRPVPTVSLGDRLLRSAGSLSWQEVVS